MTLSKWGYPEEWGHKLLFSFFGSWRLLEDEQRGLPRAAGFFSPGCLRFQADALKVQETSLACSTPLLGCPMAPWHPDHGCVFLTNGVRPRFAVKPTQKGFFASRKSKFPAGVQAGYPPRGDSSKNHELRAACSPCKFARRSNPKKMKDTCRGRVLSKWLVTMDKTHSEDL